MQKKKKLFIGITMLFIVIILIISGTIFCRTSKASRDIYKGIYINDIDVGGMSKEEAKGILEESFNEKLSNGKLVLKYEDKIFDIKYTDVGLHYDTEGAVDEAFDFGKKGNIINRTISRWILEDNIHKIALNLVYDKKALEGQVNSIVSKINKQPVDAKISFDGIKFRVSKDRYGEKVNEDKLRKTIVMKLETPFESSTIEIPVDKVDARVTFDMLSKIKTKISSFSTRFNPKDENRTENLRIASRTLDGTVVLSGEVFSMNKVLGPRDKSKGYKDAPIIVKNTLVPGLAGGICQTTTTVYNAALLSNLEILERKQHGTLVSYVGAGRDSAIYGNSIDLKFKNTNSSPIYIEAIMKRSEFIVNFYGFNEHPAQKVVITTDVYERIPSKIEYVYDETLEKGKRITEIIPIRGLKSKTYKSVYLNGRLVSKKLLSSDYYKVINGRIRVGTKIILPKEEEKDKVEDEANASNMQEKDGNDDSDKSEDTI